MYSTTAIVDNSSAIYKQLLVTPKMVTLPTLYPVHRPSTITTPSSSSSRASRDLRVGGAISSITISSSSSSSTFATLTRFCLCRGLGEISSGAARLLGRGFTGLGSRFTGEDGGDGSGGAGRSDSAMVDGFRMIGAEVWVALQELDMRTAFR